jgi:hypothetical protein
VTIKSFQTYRDDHLKIREFHTYCLGKRKDTNILRLNLLRVCVCIGKFIKEEEGRKINGEKWQFRDRKWIFFSRSHTLVNFGVSFL